MGLPMGPSRSCMASIHCSDAVFFRADEYPPLDRMARSMRIVRGVVGSRSALWAQPPRCPVLGGAPVLGLSVRAPEDCEHGDAARCDCAQDSWRAEEVAGRSTGKANIFSRADNVYDASSRQYMHTWSACMAARQIERTPEPGAWRDRAASCEMPLGQMPPSR